MDPRQRSITLRWAVSAAVLVTAAGLLTAPAFSTGLLPLGAGALATGAAATALLWWTLPSVRGARGGPAVFLLIWGACVLAGTVGDGTSRLVEGEVADPAGLPGSASGESFGWYAYEPMAPSGGSADGHQRLTTYEQSLTAVGTGVSVAPDWGGTAAGVVLGWAAGAVGAVAYRRSSRTAAAGHPAGADGPEGDDTEGPQGKA
ncbi:hypothetical protein O4J56_13955 [Nocardiopsis sp. RSe5-2]|uniref:Uncharacterized protein n=1 Tax=Nocardiopsis endophytica TaxID=3018445 RepID=A0ABT4U463_9ACTN|nr:hypothetical protein [Nocardiopsis endophytica]MDA2811741.1 hypothetical protein [Nocardiopsis endophytica]